MKSLLAGIRACCGALADTLFPQACLGCRAVLFGTSSGWCSDCLAALLRATNQLYCPTCGCDTGPYEIVDRQCRRCSSERMAHDGLVRVAAYGTLLRSVIRQYKFAHQQRLDRPLGTLLAAAIEGAPWRNEIEAVVPVPSHWTVRRKRGFHSTGSLATEAASLLGLPSLSLMVRPHRGRSQIGLSQTERRTNVRGMFRLRRGARVGGRKLCVVDDVMVTGATLRENVRVLKKAGAAAVYVAVIAKVDSLDAASVDV